MAENLWTLREQKKLSVATLASRAGLPIGLIMEYESGTRSIDARHLSRLARALYVEESQLKLRSDPRPGVGQLERQRGETPRPATAVGMSSAGSSGAAQEEASPAVAVPPRERSPRLPRQPAPPRLPAPARASQIAHLVDLLVRMGRTQADLEAELGKPLVEMDRPTVSKLLSDLQSEYRNGHGADRKRAYLPEAVDQFEHNYLMAAQAANATLNFTLFDGRHVAGQLIGFAPYSITLRLADGSEITINKLAIVSYARAAAPAAGKESAS